jgi:hypothetical protein
MSLIVEVEIKSTDTVVKQCTQALIDCGAMGCFVDIEWAKLNNILTRPLTKPIPVYNVNGTANDAGAITNIANMILCYEHHSERTQLAITHLGKQSLILGYNWLRNHNPEINWHIKDIKMSRCPLQCSTCRVEDKCNVKMQKSTTSQINACWSGCWQKKTRMNPLIWTQIRLMRRCRTQVWPLMTTLIAKLMTSLLRRITVSLWQWCIRLILTILSMLRAQCLDV